MIPHSASRWLSGLGALLAPHPFAWAGFGLTGVGP